MPIIIKQKQRELPSSGLHRAVCVDIIDDGLEETRHGKRHAVTLVWELDEEHPEFGGPHRIYRKYTLSLHEKASLYNDLTGLLGRDLTDTEKKGFDLESVKGESAMLNITHAQSNGDSFANVAAVIPLPPDKEPLEPSGDYTRTTNETSSSR